jgi:hypothetical protein
LEGDLNKHRDNLEMLVQERTNQLEIKISELRKVKEELQEVMENSLDVSYKRNLQTESYIMKHSDAEFSHSICKECAEKYCPDLDIYDD